MRIAWLGAGAALSLIIASGCSSSREPAPQKLGSTTQGIQGGDLDTSHKYAVGVSSSNGGICSGALIAPNVVVTARHCVQAIDYKNPKVPETIDCTLNPTFVGPVRTMSVTTDSSFNGAQFRSVKQVVTPPGTNLVCNNDIALLVLTNPIPSSTATPIIPGVQYAMNYSKFLQSFTAIGYGNTGPDVYDAGTRRIRQLIRIACIPGDEFIDCPAGFEPNEFVAGDGTCKGDSGSSAFEQASFQGISSVYPTPVSFGVLSRGGVSADGTNCEGSIYTRLDKFRDLVINTVTAASNNWTLYPKPNPDWTVYVPPEEKDGGTSTKPDGGTKKPGSAGFGEECQQDLDCTSRVCTDGACSQSCTADDPASCPEGYACTNDVCSVASSAPTSEPAPTTTTTTTDGCSTTGTGETSSGTLLLAGAVALVLGTRRRRKT